MLLYVAVCCCTLLYVLVCCMLLFLGLLTRGCQNAVNNARGDSSDRSLPGTGGTGQCAEGFDSCCLEM